ncbi:MAG: hypothetical protein DMD66_11700 [Gemmatimonadetes bacterium]|nr:MAG: hypothetical protein DMD66_11700 [Gemmatimonadota bacterium]
MTSIRVSFVDTYALRGAGRTLEILALRRGPNGRNPGSWETVHGTIEPGETPVQASLRELGEILQSQPHRGVLSAQARRSRSDSGVRGLCRTRCDGHTLPGARSGRVAAAPGRGGAVCVAARAQSSG